MKYDRFLPLGVLILTFFVAHTLSAQITLSPLPRKAPPSKQKAAFNSARLMNEGPVVLTLPFFDDFSWSKGEPDALLWEEGGGTHLSNTLGIRPPSVKAIVFDGADIYGNPYDFSNPQAQGEADHLRSHSFDLSASSPSDNFFISFYWQEEGLGDTPEDDDKLVLRLKDADGNWQEVWSVSGGETTGEAFQLEKVPISNPAFFHDHFQFEFVNSGRLSGSFDNWLLDYILFSNESIDDPNKRLDVAVGEQPTSLLKNYRSMPLAQFRDFEVADSIFTAVQNLSDTFNVISHDCQVVDEYSGDVVADLVTGTIGENSNFSGTSLIEKRERMKLVSLNDLSGLNVGKDSLKLRYTFTIITNESNELIPTIRNDTVRGVTNLHNFYAFDDGTAELGMGVNQRFGKIVARFVLNEPAELTDIDIYFAKLGENLAGQTVNLLVYDHIDFENNTNSKLVLRQAVPFTYSDSLNQYRRIPLSTPVLLSDTIYIGVEQLEENALTIGYDKNSLFGKNIFYNVSSQWVQNDAEELPGSMMIRPVFDSDRITGIDDEPLQQQVNVYPNPARDVIYIHSEIGINEMALVDLSGRIIQRQSYSRQKRLELSLSTLPKGMYLLHLNTQQGQLVKKIVLAK
ncbi:T9SS type A sorting domain-containing protein [Rapidithrix thailandica]|uniref:T9SS type A sorting domain-containing protein n=1 Tax=Rapidithrix thailandica TaxID=413964 RepID=A0AAW9SAA3_9BACT